MTDHLPSGPKRRNLARFALPLCIALLPFLVLLVYWPALPGGFTFDDYPNIVQNKALQVHTLSLGDWIAAIFSSHAGELQRPIAMLTFAIQHYFTGLDPLPMKAVNIGIHAANALLVFGLLRALLRAARIGATPISAWLPLAGAMMWALMPINFIPTAFIVQRMETMAHGFVFAGLWLYVSARDRQLAGKDGLWRVLAGLFLFTPLAMLCKESGAMLPLYAFCIELFVFRFRRHDQSLDRRLVAIYLVTLALPALIGGGWLLQRALRPGALATRDFTLTERLLTEPRVLFDYVRWSLLPNVREMGLYHDDYVVSRGLFSPMTTLPALLAIPALILSAWMLRRRRPLAALGIWLFFAGQAMTATIIPLELVFEHRNYFPSLGLCLVLMDLLVVAPPRPTFIRIGFALLLALGGYYGMLTRIRATEWHSPVSFALSEATRHPASPRATYQLGQAFAIVSKGDPGSLYSSMAIGALERARKVPNGNIMPAQGLLIFSSHLKRRLKDEWWAEIVERLKSRPVGAQERGAITAMTDCAVRHDCPFPADKMVPILEVATARSHHPDMYAAYTNYALNILGNTGLAERLAREAVRLSPGEPQYRANLVLVLLKERKFDDAAGEIKALRAIEQTGATTRRSGALQRELDSLRRSN